MEEKVLNTILKNKITPAYIFDADMLNDRLHMMRECLGGNIRLCYAMKANPFLISSIAHTIDCYEVCSPGEFHICEEASIPMGRIVLSGVNKEKKDITYVMSKYGCEGVYTIESQQHLEILEACAAEENIKIKALIRLSSGNQFGVDEDSLVQMISERNLYPHVQIEGVQYYSGTQKKKYEKILKEISNLDRLYVRLKEECDFVMQELEYGPGFFVPYFVMDEDVDDRGLLKQFASDLGNLEFQGRITLEMGRFIAAYCGYYLTSVMDYKTTKGQNYCIVDGGINHLNYFGQAMAMKLPHMHHITMSEEEKNKGKKEEEKLWNVCGSLCTVNDVIVKQLPLQNLELGDVLVFERTGAYSITEGIYLFLSRKLPQVFLYSKKDGLKRLREEKESYVWNTGSFS